MIRATLIVLFLLFLGTNPAVGQSLIIDMEGPWIFHVDDQFKDEAGQAKSVLIAMSPMVADHVASFSTGDGSEIKEPGIYCVGFDGVCAPAHQGSKPPFPGRILRIKTPAGWSWYGNLDKYSIYLILPIPDSYSHDGVYRMKFGKKFKNYGIERKQSIGLMLHYANGPSTINLSSKCSGPEASKCPFDDYFQDQDNSNTLRITVKAPDDLADTCDKHVRDAFHRMLLAIHNGSLQSGKNVNQDHGYIDLPLYDATCYDHDPQDDGNLLKHPMGESQPPIDVAVQLNKIIQDLGKDDLAKHELFRPNLLEDGKLLGVDGTEGARGSVPLYSQLIHIQLLLKESMDALDRLDVSAHSALPARDQAKKDEQILIDDIKKSRSALSGKNCRVAQMLIP